MKSFEIHTQRISNNVIKQNQKLDSDSLLKQTTTESSVQSQAYKVWRPASRVQSPAPRVQHPGSSFQHLRPESMHSVMPFQKVIEWIFSKFVTLWLWNKYENVLETFKCSCNLCVRKVTKNLEITSVHSSLHLCSKIWIGTVYRHSFSLQNPPSRFFIFATRKLWNYLVQVLLVAFSSSVVSD